MKYINMIVNIITTVLLFLLKKLTILKKFLKKF